MEALLTIETSHLITYGSLITLAILPIYLGSHSSLHVKLDNSEKVSSEDAYWFPIFGGGVLVGLYVLIYFLSKEYINYLLTAYFALFGTISTLNLLDKIMRELVLPKSWLPTNPIVIDIRQQDKDWLNGTLFVISSVITGAYVYSKNWILNNVLGESFSMNAIMLIELDSFKTGMIMLTGLFLYDIFFVFATDVMLTVAKSIDAPIKVLFPKNVFAKEWTFSLLGLGDIVIPGIFVALALKFDYARTGKKEKFSKPYFTACFIAYILGLVLTMLVMHITKHGQPALLYLSPACILAVLITAAIRGEIKEVFAFSPNEKKEGTKEE